MKAVMPAQAGIQERGGGCAPAWIPAFAGMTVDHRSSRFSIFHSLDKVL